MCGGNEAHGVDRQSHPVRIGHITLDVKHTGRPSAGNLPAGIDAAGTGNRLTIRLVRHSQGNGEQQIGRVYGAWRQSSALQGNTNWNLSAKIEYRRPVAIAVLVTSSQSLASHANDYRERSATPIRQR